MKRYLTIKEMLLIHDVAKTKKISVSAKRNRLAQANLSKIISAAEENIGIEIFNRDSRPLSLTEFGKGLLSHTENIIASNEAMTSYIQDFLNIPKGHVRIHCPTSVQIHLAKHIIPEIKKQLPDISLSIHTSNQGIADYSSGVIFNDDCDILITYALPENQSLVARKLHSIKMNIYSTDDFYASHPFNTLEELSLHPFLLLNTLPGNKVNENTLEITDVKENIKKKITVHGDVIFDNSYAALESCSRGLGYLLSSPLNIHHGMNVRPRLPENVGVFVNLYAIYGTHGRITMRVKSVVELIQKAFQKYNDRQP
jgi:DNA-binding transcriptional LysR family regulator